VRELANLIERAVVLGSGPEIGIDDLPTEIILEGSQVGSDDLAYRESVNATRKDLVLKALSRTDGNRAAAAKLLGLESKYFLKLMKSLGV